jgi:hypothetical protein
MPSLLCEDLDRVASRFPQTEKQRKCKHKLGYVISNSASLEKTRIFCTKCKLNFEKRQVVNWGPWEKLPDLSKE